MLDKEQIKDRMNYLDVREDSIDYEIDCLQYERDYNRKEYIALREKLFESEENT